MALLIYIKNLVVKLLNVLFGKTWIFIAVLAWFLIITGIVFLCRPARARVKLVGMSFQPVKWILLIACFYCAAALMSLSEKIGGIASCIAMIAVIVLAIKFYFNFKKKLFKKFMLWFSKIPVKHLQAFALIQIVIGYLMLFLKKRIWF